MKRTLRLGQWGVIATAILLLFWMAATVGGWSPDVRRVTSSVHGPLVGDYRAESPQILAPLSPAITADAGQDQASGGRSRPSPGPTPTPGASGSPTPTGSGVIPTLPVPTPTVPVATPTLPVPTPPLPTPPTLF